MKFKKLKRFDTQYIETKETTAMNPNALETFDEYKEYFTNYPLAWYDRKFLDSFIQKYKVKINEIVELFESVGRSEKVVKELCELTSNKNVFSMIFFTGQYLEKQKYSCRVCGIYTTKDNVAGDCSICYKWLCTKCAKFDSDRDVYCGVCFGEGDDDSDS
jgi:rubrerythrin